MKGKKIKKSSTVKGKKIKKSSTVKGKKIKKPAQKRHYHTLREQTFLSQKQKKYGYYAGFSKEEKEEERLFEEENPRMARILQDFHKQGKREVVPDLLAAVRKHKMRKFKKSEVPTQNQLVTWYYTLNRFLKDRELTTAFMEKLMGGGVSAYYTSKGQEEENADEEWPVGGGDGGQTATGGDDGDDEWADDGGDGGDGEWAAGGGDGGDGEWAAGGGDGGDGEWASPKFPNVNGKGKRRAKKIKKSSVSRKREKKANQSQYSAVESGQCTWDKVVLKGSKRTLFSSNENIVLPEEAAPSSVRGRKWKKRKV
jgi:hypothetical protein